MFDILALWLVLGFFSFGSLGISYLYSRKAADKPWNLRKDADYRPRLSIIVPTFNEGKMIRYKLRNLEKLEYPNDLMETIFVDSRSTDSTTEEIHQYIEKHPLMNVKIVEEKERRGKSSALNVALNSCSGDVVVISDADCFWPPNILYRTIPYLADPGVGAVSGPKRLLNAETSWVTRAEERYLKSMNLVKLSESKKSSTVFSEGGFSAYKRMAVDCFDPYSTGSDDCGTVIRILEKNLRSIMIPEGTFFTVFPRTLKGKIGIKRRRANQILRVFHAYAHLLLKGKLKSARGVVSKGLVLYFFAPLMFFLFIPTTFLLILQVTPMILLLMIFLVPKIGGYVFEITLNYLLLMYSMMSIALKRRFSTWKQPADRDLIQEDMLYREELI